MKEKEFVSHLDREVEVLADQWDFEDYGIGLVNGFEKGALWALKLINDKPTEHGKEQD